MGFKVCMAIKGARRKERVERKWQEKEFGAPADCRRSAESL
jgi:hypothetical protein